MGCVTSEAFSFRYDVTRLASNRCAFNATRRVYWVNSDSGFGIREEFAEVGMYAVGRNNSKIIKQWIII